MIPPITLVLKYVYKFSCFMIGIVLSQYIIYIEALQCLLVFLKKLISLSFKLIKYI